MRCFCQSEAIVCSLDEVIFQSTDFSHFHATTRDFKHKDQIGRRGDTIFGCDSPRSPNVCPYVTLAISVLQLATADYS